MYAIAELLRDPEFCEAITIMRRTESLRKGRAVIDTAEEPVQGVVQPAQGKDLERLPEADRDKETIAVFTEAALGVGEVDGAAKADGIRVHNVLYTVVSVEDWPKYGYYKALCQREGEV